MHTEAEGMSELAAPAASPEAGPERQPDGEVFSADERAFFAEGPAIETGERDILDDAAPVSRRRWRSPSAVLAIAAPLVLASLVFVAGADRAPPPSHAAALPPAPARLAAPVASPSALPPAASAPAPAATEVVTEPLAEVVVTEPPAEVVAPPTPSADEKPRRRNASARHPGRASRRAP